MEPIEVTKRLQNTIVLRCVNHKTARISKFAFHCTLFTFMFIRLSTINISRYDEITFMNFDTEAPKCREHVQILTKLHKTNEILRR